MIRFNINMKIILAGLFVALLAGSLYAQGFDNYRQSKGFGKGHGPGHFDESRMKNLENLRLLKLLEMLELSDDQNTMFIASFSTFRNKMKDIHDSVNVEVEKLSEILKQEKPSDKDILQIVERIKTFRKEQLQNGEKFITSVKEILTPIQLGKLIVFEERFDRQLMESIRGFRGGDGPKFPDDDQGR